MSLDWLILWSLVRAIVVAAGAVALGRDAATWLSSDRPINIRRIVIAALVVVWLTPSLLTAYGWADFSLSLVRYPAINEALYTLLVTLKLMPVAVLVIRLAPPPALSAEAAFCATLTPAMSTMHTRKWRWRFAHLTHGPMRVGLLAALVCGVLAFGEFEMAARFGAASWTVWLFDAHAGGLALGESLRSAAGPVIVQFVALAAVIPLLSKLPSQETEASSPVHNSARWRGALGGVAVIAALLLVCLTPGAVVLRGAWEGATALAQRFALWRELGNSFLLALVTASAAAGLGWWLVARQRGRRMRWFVVIPLVAPGLLGALVLALTMHTLAGRLPLAQPTDSPLWLLATLTLLLMPISVVLSLAIHRPGARAMRHAARLLHHSRDREVRGQSKRIRWQLTGQALFLTVAALFYLAYFELVASAILAPITMPVASVRLHNLMHYGQSPVLSGMMVVMVALPLIVAATVFAMIRWTPRMMFRG